MICIASALSGAGGPSDGGGGGGGGVAADNDDEECCPDDDVTRIGNFCNATDNWLGVSFVISLRLPYTELVARLDVRLGGRTSSTWLLVLGAAA
jgi:hypothetical protein